MSAGDADIAEEEAVDFNLRCPRCSHEFPIGQALLADELEPAEVENSTGVPDTSLSELGCSETLEMPPKVAPTQPAQPTPQSGWATETETDAAQVVSRCYQILNWTIEELERVICDPDDRRIRKISSISRCDIEIRSEMPVTKFGTPKNFCVLRARQPVSVDQCRSLLRQQMGWVLKPRLHTTQT